MKEGTVENWLQCTYVDKKDLWKRSSLSQHRNDSTRLSLQHATELWRVMGADLWMSVRDSFI